MFWMARLVILGLSQNSERNSECQLRHSLQRNTLTQETFFHVIPPGRVAAECTLALAFQYYNALKIFFGFQRPCISSLVEGPFRI